MARRFAHRYLLNKNTCEVHDLDNEKAGCRIDEIQQHHIEWFDDLEAALKRQEEVCLIRNGCAHCLPRYHTF